MKNWQVAVISISMIVGGLLASGGVSKSLAEDPAPKGALDWQMTTGPIAYFYSTTSRSAYVCDYRPGIKTACAPISFP